MSLQEIFYGKFQASSFCIVHLHKHVSMVTWGSRTNTRPANNQHWVFDLVPQENTGQTKHIQLLPVSGCPHFPSPDLHKPTKPEKPNAPFQHDPLFDSSQVWQWRSLKAANFSWGVKRTFFWGSINAHMKEAIAVWHQPELSPQMQIQRKPCFISSVPQKNPCNIEILNRTEKHN